MTTDNSTPSPASRRLPDEDAEERRQSLIRRLCALQAVVSGEWFGYQHAADCFCLTLPDGSRSLSPEWPWSNEGKAVEFIEQAVREKLANTASQPPEEGSQ